MKKRFLLILVVFFLVNKILASEDMNSKQKNSYDLMNFITVSTMDIKEANNFYSLEEIRKTLQNDINPRLIDEKTKQHIKLLSQSITEDKLLLLKRERIDYLFENAKAEAYKKAIPDPMFLLSGTLAGGGIPGALATLGMVTISSISNYVNAKDQAELQYLQSNWDLIGERVSAIDTRLTNMFGYRVDIANDYKIPDAYYILDSNSVNIYSEIKAYKSSEREDDCLNQIEEFEKNKSIFEWYAPYWLDLSSAYYYKTSFCDENEKEFFYRKSLESYMKYKEIAPTFFVRDTYYAKHIPMAIFCAEQILSKEELLKFELSELADMEKNWSLTDVDLHYIAAQIYISIAKKTNDQKYLKKAFDLINQNITPLIKNQRELIDQWVNPVPKINTGALPEEKAQYDYISSLRKESKPPVNQTLLLNSELLFELMNVTNISDSKRKEIKTRFDSVSMLYDFSDVSSFKIKELENIEFPEQIKQSKKNSIREILIGIAIFILINVVSFFLSRYLEGDGRIDEIYRAIIGVLLPIIVFVIFRSISLSLCVLIVYELIYFWGDRAYMRSCFPTIFIVTVFSIIGALVPVIIFILNFSLIRIGITAIITVVVFGIIMEILAKITYAIGY